MKRSIAACLCAGLLLSAPAAEWTKFGEKETIQMTPEEAAECGVKGECAIFSRRDIALMLEAQRELTRTEDRKECIFSGIARGV